MPGVFKEEKTESMVQDDSNQGCKEKEGTMKLLVGCRVCMLVSGPMERPCSGNNEL